MRVWSPGGRAGRIPRTAARRGRSCGFLPDAHCYGEDVDELPDVGVDLPLRGSAGVPVAFVGGVGGVAGGAWAVAVAEVADVGRGCAAGLQPGHGYRLPS